MVKTLVQFCAAYMEEPVMMKDKDDDIFYHRDTGSLDISAELKRAITAWDSAYQKTLEQGYPPDSAFPSAEAERTHLAEGRRLARALQNELGDAFAVEYRHY